MERPTKTPSLQKSVTCHLTPLYSNQTDIASVYIVKDFGRASGVAFVEFAGLQDAQKAAMKDRQMLGTRYIEIFESTVEERARYMCR